MHILIYLFLFFFFFFFTTLSFWQSGEIAWIWKEDMSYVNDIVSINFVCVGEDSMRVKRNPSNSLSESFWKQINLFLRADWPEVLDVQNCTIVISRNSFLKYFSPLNCWTAEMDTCLCLGKCWQIPNCKWFLWWTGISEVALLSVLVSVLECSSSVLLWSRSEQLWSLHFLAWKFSIFKAMNTSCC